MISEKMAEALNKQINAELYSWYLYLAMAAHFEDQNFTGTAKWLKLQANEEMGHAMKFFQYLNDVDKKVQLSKIDAPPEKLGNHTEVFEQVVKHELLITKNINDLADLAVAEKDHATGNFLIWFVNEQVEEVAAAKQIFEKIKMVNNVPGGFFMIDRELGMRA
ncbi:MAG: ferritin [Ignavibacteriales bacterium]|nr:MAG: ferritin [Ignavibacteriales bacterium]